MLNLKSHIYKILLYQLVLIFLFNYINLFCILPSIVNQNPEIENEITVLKEKLYTSSNKDSVYFNNLESITNYYIPINIDSSLVYANLHLTHAITKNSSNEIINAYSNIGNIYQSIGKETNALMFFQKAFDFAIETQDYKSINKIANTLSLTYQSTGEFAKAQEILNLSHKEIKKSKNPDLIGNSLINLASLNVHTYKVDEAIDLYIEASNYFKKSNNLKKIATTYSDIGLVYKTTLDFDKALFYLNKTYKIEKELNKLNKNNLSKTPSTIHTIEYNIGSVYKEMKKYENALKFLKDAVEGNIKIDNTLFVLRSSILITQTYLEIDSLEKALEYYKIVTNYEKKNTNKMVKLNIKSLQAEVFNKQKKYNEAFDIIDNCIKENSNLKNTKIMLNLIEIGLISLEHLNNSDAFVRYLKLKNRLIDSSYQIKLLNKTSILKSKYEYNKKLTNTIEENRIKKISEEKDLVFQSTIKWLFIGFTVILSALGIFLYKNLKKSRVINNELEKNKLELEQYNLEITENNLLISKQKEELYNINKTLDKYVNILSHDLRSPLSGIMLSINNIIEYKEKFTKEQILIKLEKIKISIINSYNLLDELLKFSTQINVSVYNPHPTLLNQIIEKNENLFQENLSNKKISLLINIDKKTLVNVDNKLIDSVFRNLLSNAIKFTNKNGTIIINSEEYEKNSILICVQDTGIGMSQTQMENLFNLDKLKSTEGTEGEKGFGFGMILVKENIEKHNCKIWVESEFEKGTKFYFTLPKANTQIRNYTSIE